MVPMRTTHTWTNTEVSSIIVNIVIKHLVRHRIGIITIPATRDNIVLSATCAAKDLT